MGFTLKTNLEPSKELVASELEIGDLAEIVDMPDTGRIVLRTFDRLVSLDYPGESWWCDCTFLVRRLPRGTVLTITVES